MRFRLDSSNRGPLVVVLSAALVCVAIGIPGCARPNAPTAASPQESATPSANDTGVKPSEAEAREFAKGLIAAIESNDINKFNAFVDWTALLEQATSGIDVPAGWRQDFQTGLPLHAGQAGGPFRAAGHGSGVGRIPQLLHVHDVKGRPRALIRFIGADSELNYLDFDLATSRRPGSCR